MNDERHPVMQRRVGDHLRLDPPLHMPSYDRSGPRWPVPERFRPQPTCLLTRCLLFSRYNGVFPGDAELVPLDIGGAAPVAGEA